MYVRKFLNLICLNENMLKKYLKMRNPQEKINRITQKVKQYIFEYALQNGFTTCSNLEEFLVESGVAMQYVILFTIPMLTNVDEDCIGDNIEDVYSKIGKIFGDKFNVQNN